MTPTPEARRGFSVPTMLIPRRPFPGKPSPRRERYRAARRALLAAVDEAFKTLSEDPIATAALSNALRVESDRRAKAAVALVREEFVCENGKK